MSQKGSGANRGNTSRQEEFRLVIVGDKACGKTALLTVYTEGVFPEVRDAHWWLLSLDLLDFLDFHPKVGMSAV